MMLVKNPDRKMLSLIEKIISMTNNIAVYDKKVYGVKILVHTSKIFVAFNVSSVENKNSG